MSKTTLAERLLQELGVTAPSEIDLEPIAYYLGARVRFAPLSGCEARIIGSGDKAVITVNSRSSRRRQRFSIAHELGHWQLHRGGKLICRVQEMEREERNAASSERRADNYAADLLMPYYLFRPAIRVHSMLSFSTVSKLANMFECSYTAAAIRSVESDELPGFVICHGKYGRRWFARSPCIPKRWFPKADLSERSHAFGVLFGGKPGNPNLYQISADAWFDDSDSSLYRISEQTIRLNENEALTLLAITDAKMLQGPEASD